MMGEATVTVGQDIFLFTSTSSVDLFTTHINNLSHDSVNKSNRATFLTTSDYSVTHGMVSASSGQSGLSAASIVKVVLLALILVTSVLGNSVVLYILVARLRINTVSNVFIAALSASDLIIAITCMPMSVASLVVSGWVGGNVLCLVNETLNSALGLLSTVMVTAITIERYYGIVKLPKTTLPVYAACILTGMTVLAAIGISLPWFLLVYGHKMSSQYHKEGYCHCMYIFHVYGSHQGAIFSIIYVSVLYVVPMVAMTSGAWSLWKLTHLNMCRVQPATSHPSQLRFSGELRTGKTVIIMVVCFFITRGPYVIMSLIVAISKADFSTTMDTTAMWLAWTGCLVNPLIYAFRNPNVLKIFRVHQNKYQNHIPPREKDDVSNTTGVQNPVPKNNLNIYIIPNLTSNNVHKKDSIEEWVANTHGMEPPPIDTDWSNVDGDQSVEQGEYTARLDDVCVEEEEEDVYNGERSDSIPSVLFFINQPRKGSAQSSATSCTTTTTV